MKSYRWQYRNNKPEVADAMCRQAICSSSEDKTIWNTLDINKYNDSKWLSLWLHIKDIKGR